MQFCTNTSKQIQLFEYYKNKGRNNISKNKRSYIAIKTEHKFQTQEAYRKERITAPKTIRRDLERLEAEGRLLRSHGGAVSVRSSDREATFSEREISYIQEKIAISREAVRRVEEGDTILLDASTTAWQMARLLPDIRLTVVTNAIKVAAQAR